MKTQKFLLALVLVAGLTACSSENVSHEADNLPAKASQLISRNFTAGVSLVKTEKDLGRVSEYEVTLTDGSTIEFNSSGEWKSIDTPNNLAVPAGVVPTNISTFVREKQAGTSIVGIEKEKHGYEVQLSNGVEMKFDLSGNFMQYD